MIKTRVTKLTITPGELFHERGFSVEIVDEAGGEFVEVRSNESGSPLRIDVEEWPFLRDAIDRMFVEIAESEKSEGQAPPASGDDGWIPWSGGECPVDGETRVIVQLRYEFCPDETSRPTPASSWSWDWMESDGDIIVYKVVE